MIVVKSEIWNLKSVLVRAGVLVVLAALAPPGRTVSAQPRSAAAPKTSTSDAVPFDGGRAFDDLKKLVAFGPRPSGSKALDEARSWMIRELKQNGCAVEEDSFTASTPAGNIPMTNLIVKIPGSKPDVVMVAGHYDTKRFEQFKFVGANDGGSSAALLLELGRQLCHRQTALTTWLVFFDGEEAVREQWQGTDNDYGSRHLVERLTAQGELSRVKAMILVDMVGDAKLDIRRDPGSTAWLSELEFSTARRLGYSRYFLERQSVTVGGDDYDPWLAAGVSSVDLIDFNYGPNARSRPGDPDWNIYWHTAQDTLEHCSPQSLEVVGRVVLAMLQELDNSPHVR